MYPGDTLQRKNVGQAYEKLFYGRQLPCNMGKERK